jgi:hypothetical protein
MCCVEFRRNAEACLRLALASADSASKNMFVDLAQAWLRLAERVEAGLRYGGGPAPLGSCPTPHVIPRPTCVFGANSRLSANRITGQRAPLTRVALANCHVDRSPLKMPNRNNSIFKAELDPRHNIHSWRCWYKTPTWKSIRRHRLAQEPRCRACAAEGQTVVASHVDHVEPPQGEWSLFVKYENTRSLCARHHNALRHRQEKRRNSTEPATDGPAIGLQHPFRH